MPDHQKTQTVVSPCLGDVTSGRGGRCVTKTRQRNPDQRLARAFAHNARAFHAMAWSDDDRVGAQTAYHSAIAIELGLKAYLLHRGLSDDWNRAHLRHDLTKALRCVWMLGFEDVPEGIAELAAVLGPLYASGALRSGLVSPDLPLSPDDADKAICDLLSAVEAAIGIDSETDQ
ncbi:hypothetical protein [Brevundimonas vesicularis]|uniref:hypothetical protein n=1 Tax=Brevundimonas vesicularis TaxID=41276 RepID=UPI0038D4810E